MTTIEDIARSAAQALDGAYKDDPKALVELVMQATESRIVAEAQNRVTELLSGEYRDQIDDLLVSLVKSWIESGRLGRKIQPSDRWKEALERSSKRLNVEQCEKIFEKRNWQIFEARSKGKSLKSISQEYGISSSRVREIVENMQSKYEWAQSICRRFEKLEKRTK